MKWLVVVVGFVALGAGCSEPSPSPAAVATDFVSQVRLAETEAGRRAAYDLLAADARAALKKRAAVAAAGAGVSEEAVAPWDVPRYLGLVGGDRVVSAEALDVRADRATVRVHMANYYAGAAGGEAAQGRDVDLRLVREGGAWKVALGFPAAASGDGP